MNNNLKMLNIGTVLGAVSLLAPGVLGHGWLKTAILNGKEYTLWPKVRVPDWTAPAISITRQIGYDGPVIDILGNNITCNNRAVPINDNGVSRTGEITAGSEIKLYWEGWPHSGPILTYMAKCDPNCGSFTGHTGKPWFKIHEVGWLDGSWATQHLHDQGYWWNVTIPKCLPDGEYLLRHEIMAMSDCKTVGKCQFYPSCTQLKVTGGGTVSPPTSAKVGFPGAYGQKDKGILWDTNTQDPSTYVPPGPKVWSCT